MKQHQLARTGMWHLLLSGSLLASCLPGTAPSAIKNDDSMRPLASSQFAPADPPSGPSTGCYYSWSSMERPELSATFDARLRAIDPVLTGSAYAFGEDCNKPDGSVTFLAMETDFRLQIRVPTLADEEALGSWLRKVFRVVEGLPADERLGTRPGRVEFLFIVSASESLRLTVDIARYRLESPGLEDAALYRHFAGE